MGPSKKEPEGSGDLFPARLDQIINLKHELVRLADELDWDWIDAELADCFAEQGRPGTEVRFMVGLLLLKLTQYPEPRSSADAYCWCREPTGAGCIPTTGPSAPAIRKQSGARDRATMAFQWVAFANLEVP